MVQYYGNENFDENNEVWKFWQIELNKYRFHHYIPYHNFVPYGIPLQISYGSS